MSKTLDLIFSAHLLRGYQYALEEYSPPRKSPSGAGDFGVVYVVRNNSNSRSGAIRCGYFFVMRC